MQIARLRRADREIDRTEGASVVMFAGASKSLMRGLGWGRRREDDGRTTRGDLTAILHPSEALVRDRGNHHIRKFIQPIRWLV